MRSRMVSLENPKLALDVGSKTSCKLPKPAVVETTSCTPKKNIQLDAAIIHLVVGHGEIIEDQTTTNAPDTAVELETPQALARALLELSINTGHGALKASLNFR